MRKLILITALLFLVGVIGLYLSSISFLRGVSQMSAANNLLNTISQVSEGLDSSNQGLQKLQMTKDLADVQFEVTASQKLATDALKSATRMLRYYPHTLVLFREANASLARYSDSLNSLFSHWKNSKTPIQKGALSSDILVAQQFGLEAKESLRKLQIELKKQSDASFSAVYRFRHLPLAVAVTMALFFFTIVLAVGTHEARGLERSIMNLFTATDAVVHDRLEYRAPILTHDEIGRLTFEFNRMVESLEAERRRLTTSKDRIGRLQAITAAFSEALRPDEVMEVVIRQGLEALGAERGVFGLGIEDGSALEIRCPIGFGESESLIREKFGKIDIKDNLPLSIAFRRQELVAVESLDSLRRSFSLLGREPLNLLRSFVAVPVVVEKKSLGAFLLGFANDRLISEEEKTFLLAIGRLCAQALKRSQLFEEAQKAIEVRDEFLSIASHELKTPLTPLKLQLQTFIRLTRSGDVSRLTSERVMRIAESANKQIERLASLIEDLLDVSRINAGRLTLNPEETDLKVIVDEVVARYRGQLSQAKCEVELRAEPGLVMRSDRLRIEQVIANLLTNAAKYAAGTLVSISLHKVHDRARLSVHDNGPGVDPQYRDRIFDRFERIRPSSVVGGLGLGLYISRQIVEAHGGRIWVESEMGHGSTFIVELPLLQGLPSTKAG